MFTGIVEGTGIVRQIEERPGGRKLWIDIGALAEGLRIGGSVSVNGCCTTVVDLKDRVFATELMEITLQKTNLGDVVAGTPVNIERPMKMGDELGGHLVQGHVDGVGEIIKVTPLESSHVIEIRVPRPLVKYVVATGSVSVNGVSMTVADIQSDVLTLGVIPHTWEVTNFSEFRAGRRVNIEVDLIGKYIEKLLPDLWSGLTKPRTEAK
ncbi:riboflavin synthase [bacterium]|nr:riboflavin synthase [bacterium]MBU1984466.1 riboflavin synthase [bacterium]